MPVFVQRGGLWVLTQFVLLLMIAVLGVFYSSPSRHWGLVAIGVLLLAISAICGVAGTLSLGSSLTPFPKPSSRTRLVQDGIYAFVRHPLYVAVTCGAVGFALVRGSWPALVAALALGPFFDAKARVEERALSRQFPEYAQYRTKVKRFIPGMY